MSFNRNAALLAVLCSSSIAAQESLPWSAYVDPEGMAPGIYTVSSEASVSVSDGLTYDVSTSFHDRQRAVLQFVYPDRTFADGIDGMYVWRYDGESETEIHPGFKNFILAHQVHAQILFFDKLHPRLGAPEEVVFEGTDCLAVSNNDTTQPMRFFYADSSMPLGLEIIHADTIRITYTFDDWRTVGQLQLPFLVIIDDGDRIFEYAFQHVHLNEGSIADYRAPYASLSEEQKLMRLHRIVMDGHLFGTTDEMKANQGDSLIILSEGDIYRVAGNRPDSQLDRIIASRDYTIYDDLVKPVVKVSPDGQLGWVLAQVYAKGIRVDEDGNPTGPVEFTCAWIELYEKMNGDWKLTGNVSNFRPGRR